MVTLQRNRMTLLTVWNGDVPTQIMSSNVIVSQNVHLAEWNGRPHQISFPFPHPQHPSLPPPRCCEYLGQHLNLRLVESEQTHTERGRGALFWRARERHGLGWLGLSWRLATTIKAAVCGGKSKPGARHAGPILPSFLPLRLSRGLFFKVCHA